MLEYVKKRTGNRAEDLCLREAAERRRIGAAVRDPNDEYHVIDLCAYEQLDFRLRSYFF